jgi:hypothetical protein
MILSPSMKVEKGDRLTDSVKSDMAKLVPTLTNKIRMEEARLEKLSGIADFMYVRCAHLCKCDEMLDGTVRLKDHFLAGKCPIIGTGRCAKCETVLTSETVFDVRTLPVDSLEQAAEWRLKIGDLAGGQDFANKLIGEFKVELSKLKLTLEQLIGEANHLRVSIDAQEDYLSFIQFEIAPKVAEGEYKRFDGNRNVEICFEPKLTSRGQVNWDGPDFSAEIDLLDNQEDLANAELQTALVALQLFFQGLIVAGITKLENIIQFAPERAWNAEKGEPRPMVDELYSLLNDKRGWKGTHDDWKDAVSWRQLILSWNSAMGALNRVKYHETESKPETVFPFQCKDVPPPVRARNPSKVPRFIQDAEGWNNSTRVPVEPKTPVAKTSLAPAVTENPFDSLKSGPSGFSGTTSTAASRKKEAALKRLDAAIAKTSTPSVDVEEVPLAPKARAVVKVAASPSGVAAAEAKAPVPPSGVTEKAEPLGKRGKAAPIVKIGNPTAQKQEDSAIAKSALGLVGFDQQQPTGSRSVDLISSPKLDNAKVPESKLSDANGFVNVESVLTYIKVDDILIPAVVPLEILKRSKALHNGFIRGVGPVCFPNTIVSESWGVPLPYRNHEGKLVVPQGGQKPPPQQAKPPVWKPASSSPPPSNEVEGEQIVLSAQQPKSKKAHAVEVSEAYFPDDDVAPPSLSTLKRVEREKESESPVEVKLPEKKKKAGVVVRVPAKALAKPSPPQQQQVQEVEVEATIVTHGVKAKAQKALPQPAVSTAVKKSGKVAAKAASKPEGKVPAKARSPSPVAASAKAVAVPVPVAPAKKVAKPAPSTLVAKEALIPKTAPKKPAAPRAPSPPKVEEEEQPLRPRLKVECPRCHQMVDRLLTHGRLCKTFVNPIAAPGTDVQGAVRHPKALKYNLSKEDVQALRAALELKSRTELEEGEKFQPTPNWAMQLAALFGMEFALANVSQLDGPSAIEYIEANAPTYIAADGRSAMLALKEQWKAVKALYPDTLLTNKPIRKEEKELRSTHQSIRTQIEKVLLEDPSLDRLARFLPVIRKEPKVVAPEVPVPREKRAASLKKPAAKPAAPIAKTVEPNPMQILQQSMKDMCGMFKEVASVLKELR